MNNRMKCSMLVLMVIILAAFGSVILAQDDTQDDATLESVTADTEGYLGQEVTLEGVIAELVNVRAFVLGEGAALDDDQVLVINNSGHEFDLRVTAGQRIRVTGIVHANYVDNGLSGITTSMSTLADDADTVVVEEPLDMTEEPMIDVTEEAPLGMAEEPMMEATAEVLVDTPDNRGMQDDGLFQMDVIDLSTMELPEHLHNHTIIEITSISAITFVEEAE